MGGTEGPAQVNIDNEKAGVELVEYGGQKVVAEVDYSGVGEKTDPLEIKLVRKLDLIIIPTLWIMYFCNFMDRNAITNGKLNTLTEDLNLKGGQYNTAISILFCGYLIGQIPSNMVLTRVRPSLYLAGFTMIWSVISALMAVVRDYKGLLLTRFFLGFVEAPFYPGALYLLSVFYTKKELSLRIALFYTGNIAANAFCGLIAAAVFATLDNVHGLAGWRWLFLISGVVSFGIGLVGLIALPDTPLTTWWLSAEERQLAHDRVKRDTTEHAGSTSVWNGLKQAVTDYRTWLFCFNMNTHVSAESFKNFFPSVVQTLGFNTTVTLALTCPPYVVSGFVSAALSWSSGKRNERTWHMIIGTFFDIVGFVMAAATTNVAVRYVGMVIFVSLSSGVNDICLGWAASTLGQTPEKKAVAMALINMLSNVASVYTPYLWPSSDAPRYITGMSASAAFSVAVIVTTWFTKVALKRDNERIRRTAPETLVLYAY
ncbi:major facilitator superfamily domain-containing protein [Lipomyces kononenkoae]|uniref:Major facilitator superfamily domain-containing protein n=1 Tax=Lipomyces kononenkoae TaxID=34357 RepID=A0ACC3SXC9_LIPKO